MKKFLSAILSGMMMMGISASAQDDYGCFNSLAAGVGAGLSGIGVNLASPLGYHFDLRAGALFMPGIRLSTDVGAETAHDGASTLSTMQVNGDLGRISGEILLNYYPFRSTDFFLTAGAAFAGGKLMKIDGHDDELGRQVAEGNPVGISIGDCVLPVDENGDVSGGLEVYPVRPYIGLGFGRAVPRKRLGFMVEMGVQIHGTPDVYSDSEMTKGTTIDADDTFTNVIDKLKVYPVLKFTLTGRIF